MAITAADCDLITSRIIRETGRISPEIYSRIVRTGPWIGLTPRAEFPDGMGVIQTNMMFERILPANSEGDTWADVAPSDGTTPDQCLPPTETLTWGQTLRTWRLQSLAKQTEEFCLEDLRTAFELQKVLQMYTDGLTKVTKWVWENRDRNEYTLMSLHKVTETSASFDINATAFDPANPPTSRLLNGTIEQIYNMLIDEGAGPDALGFSEDGNAPIFSLITDMNTSRDLIRQDPELRSDFRFAYEGSGKNSPLIAPLGVARAYNGFKHLLDFFPARYEIVGGVYTRIPPFKSAQATTSGNKRDLNPAWLYATYQDSVVHLPSVFTQRIPKPISSPGGKFKFDPVNYMGDFSFKNILHKICNPDGTKGFFRAVFKSASEPVHPEYGWVIRHLSCPPLRKPLPSCYS